MGRTRRRRQEKPSIQEEEVKIMSTGNHMVLENPGRQHQISKRQETGTVRQDQFD